MKAHPLIRSLLLGNRSWEQFSILIKSRGPFKPLGNRGKKRAMDYLCLKVNRRKNKPSVASATDLDCNN